MREIVVLTDLYYVSQALDLFFLEHSELLGKNICFIDVEKMKTIYDLLYVMSIFYIRGYQIILFSRGGVLSRSLSEIIDVSLNDPVKKWISLIKKKERYINGDKIKFVRGYFLMKKLSNRERIMAIDIIGDRKGYKSKQFKTIGSYKAEMGRLKSIASKYDLTTTNDILCFLGWHFK